MSRPRSPARGANAGGAAARPAARGVYVQTPKSDIYVAMLGVALGAMILGCVLLVLVLQRYEFKTKVSMAPRAMPALTLATAPFSENLSTVRL